VPPGQVIRAKVEAVLGCIALVFAPFVLVLGHASPMHGIVASAGILLAALSATAIQFWFRAQAKRTHFRRRQTSSRVATFAEAFSSIAWAGTAALAASESRFALAGALAALVVLVCARAVSPAREPAGRVAPAGRRFALIGRPPCNRFWRKSVRSPRWDRNPPPP
jgi:ABC-2 type transport system permease protein